MSSEYDPFKPQLDGFVFYNLDTMRWYLVPFAIIFNTISVFIQLMFAFLGGVFFFLMLVFMVAITIPYIIFEEVGGACSESFKRVFGKEYWG